MLPYLTGIDVKTAFLKLQKVLGITTIIEESEGNIKKIEALENALVELEKENKNLKTRIEVLQSKLESHETIITDLNERLTYFEKHGKKKPSFVFR
jgi:predicted  nucleic acid-binding Zn-ribbon protein